MHQHEYITYVQATAQQLGAAAQGERGVIAARAAEFLQCSPQTLYRHLRTHAGYAQGRKTRTDAGNIKTDKELALLAAGMISTKGTRANGKRILSIEDCRERLAAQGFGVADAETGEVIMPSASALSRAMRQYGCHPDQVAAGSPHVTMRSLHPNQVWQLDASVCVMVYLPGRKRVTVMDESLYNDKKPGNLVDIGNARLVRYVVADHCSHTLYSHYVLARGEDAEGFVGTLINAISDRGPRDPMHGAPSILYTDPGSGLRAALMKNLCRDLQIKLIHHAPGNARATGSAEVAQNIIERKFESRLRFMDVPDLATLNAQSDVWRMHFNAHARHTRLRCPRNLAWLRITDAQLRTVDRDVLTAIAAWQDQSRVVRDDYRISVDTRTRYGTHEYDVRVLGHHGVSVGDKVTVRLNPFNAPAIVVLLKGPDGGELRFEVPPVQKDAFGFDVSAPVWGESYKALPQTATDKAVKDAARVGREGMAGTQMVATATPGMAGIVQDGTAHPYAFINPMADVRQAPLAMRRAGTQLDLAAPSVQSVPLNHVQAIGRLQALDMEPWEVDRRACNALIKGRYPDCVPDTAIDELRIALRGLLPVRATTVQFATATVITGITGLPAHEAAPRKAAGGIA